MLPGEAEGLAAGLDLFFDFEITVGRGQANAE
jgi:hypothetical protein